MEVIWRTAKVLDEQGMITAVSWEAEAWEGVFHCFERGVCPLAPADAVLVAADQQRRLDNSDAADAPGYVRQEWVQRDMLEAWLFAGIDRNALETALIARVRQDQSDKS